MKSLKPASWFLGILCLGFLSAWGGRNASPPADGQMEQDVMSRALEPGQAVIRYLFHSGWAVKTKNHLLIFDYTEPVQGELIRKRIVPNADFSEVDQRMGIWLQLRCHDGACSCRRDTRSILWAELSPELLRY